MKAASRYCLLWCATALAMAPLTAQTLDTEPPQLVGMRVSPSIVDVTDGPVEVRMEFDITDDVSGFAQGQPRLRFGNTVFRYGLSGGALVSGSPLNGTYTSTITIPEGTPPGERTFEVLLWDNEGRTGFHYPDTTFTVVNNGPVDREPPTIHSITVEPKVVDLTNGPQSVTFTLDISDDVTGVVSMYLGIAPTDPELNYIDFRSWRQFSSEGNERKTFTLKVPLDEYTPEGEWQLTIDNLADRVFLPSPYNEKPAKVVEDFDATFEVINPNGDATPPELIKVEFLETVANTAYETSFLPWRVQFADRPSGVELVSVYLYAPTGADNYIYSGAIYDQLNVVDIYGDTLEGVIEVPRYIQTGQHRVQVLMRDVSGNQIKYGAFGSKPLPPGSTEFITVEASAGNDTRDVFVTGFSYSPDPIDVTGGTQTVTFEVDFEDDLSGLDYISLTIYDPDGNSFERARLNPDDLISGNPIAGTLFYAFEIPRYSPPGDYRIRSLTTRDQAGNFFSDATYPVFPVNLQSAFTVINNGPAETQPPEILSVNMPETVIEIDRDRRPVAISATARDDLSGVSDVWIRFTHEEDPDQTLLFVMRAPRDVVNEDGLTRTFQDTSVFREFNVPGTYVLDRCWVTDAFGLRREYEIGDAAALPPGLPTEITVINSGQIDTAAPQYTDIRLSATEFDVSFYPGSLTIEIDFDEDTSGLSHVDIDIYNRDEFYRVGLFSTRSTSELLDLTGGILLQGTFRKTVEIPRFIPPGTYEVQYKLEDNAFRSNSIDGNDDDFPFPGRDFVTITNTGSVDFLDPLLRDLDILESVDVSDEAAVINLSLEAIDDLAGLGRIFVGLDSPSDSDFTNDVVEPRSEDGSPIKEGRFPMTLTIPAFAEPGEWKLEVTLQDRNSGYKRYESVDLRRWGFPDTVTVINTRPPGYLWKESDEVYANGWRQVDWFGWVQDQGDYPFVYHLEHGWIYTSGSQLEQFAFYELTLGIWWWISEANYPWMYASAGPGRTGWVYYYAPFGTPGNRWFYDASTGQIIPEAELFGN